MVIAGGKISFVALTMSRDRFVFYRVSGIPAKALRQEIYQFCLQCSTLLIPSDLDVLSSSKHERKPVCKGNVTSGSVDQKLVENRSR